MRSIRIPAPSDIRAVRLQDVNSDASADLVTFSRTGVVSVRLATSGGLSQAATGYAASIQPLRAIRADIDGNGSADFVALDYAMGQPFLNNGDGTLTPKSSFVIAGPSPNDFAVGDMNNDGAADIFISSEGAIEYFQSNGDGTFKPAQPITQATRILGSPWEIWMPMAIAISWLRTRRPRTVSRTLPQHGQRNPGCAHTQPRYIRRCDRASRSESRQQARPHLLPGSKRAARRRQRGLLG